MKLFRKGDRWLVYFNEGRAWSYDARTGDAGPDFDPRTVPEAEWLTWKPVFEDDAVPAGLAARLVLKLPERP